MKISTKIRVLLLLLFVSANLKSAFADVIITQPTGGQNISTERSVGGPSEQFTAIGDIVITDQVGTDFQSGTDRRIRLNAPSGWQFEVGTASAAGTGTRVTSATVIESTATYIVISYNANTTVVAGNAITLSGLRVKSTSRAVAYPNYIIRANTSRNAVIAGFPNGATAATLSKVAGAYVGLQVLLPAQDNAPGSGSGRSNSTVQTPQAGSSFAVTVNAVDYAYNIITDAPEQQVSITTNNPYATISAPVVLTGGTASFNVALNTYSATLTTSYFTLTANNDVDNGIVPGVSSNIRVMAGPFTKLLTVFPGETYAPGSPNGKTGTPTAPAYGVNYTSVVYAVDDFWNKATAPDPTNVEMSASGVTNFAAPPQASLLVSGPNIRTRTFNLVFGTIGETPTVTAVNNTDGTKTAYTQILPAVTAGAFVKLQLLLPGEVAAPGTPTGKTGAPIAQAAGTPFDVTVNAVDANWNLVSSVTDVVAITNSLASDAATSLLPANAALVAGTGTFSVTLNRAATNHRLVASDVTNPAKTANTSPDVEVTVGAYAKLLITLTGETYLPGTATGKGNTLTSRAINTNTTVTVRAVDAHWNLVNTVTDMVELSSSDLNAIVPADQALVAGVRAFSGFRFRTAGDQTITATSAADAGKNYTTGLINVAAGAFTKLVLVMPGETAVEGIAAGKTGTPTDRVAGETFSILVKAADAYGNTVTTVNDVVGFTATNDIYAQLPPNTALVNGVLNASVTYRIGSTSKNRRLTVTDITDGTKTASQSATFIVNIGPYAGLLVVLPGEVYKAGSPTGKEEPPGNQGIGVAFNVVVRAVDIAFNTITSVTDVVSITSNDPLAVLPANAALVNGVKSNFSVRLNSASTSTTITATSADVTKSPYTAGPIVVLGPSAASNFFRSNVVSGNWNNSTSWESSANGTSGWQPSTLVPNQVASGITVRNGHTIKIIAAQTVDDVTIENGAMVDHTAGTLTINDGVAANDFMVSGIFRSAAAITKNGVLQILNGGTYQHNYTTATGTIPAAVWATGSTCEVIGYTTFAGNVTGSNQTFSNFVWNAANQTAAGSPSLLAGFAARDLTVNSTGLGSLNLGSVGGTTTITRDYVQTAGTVRANKTSGTQNLAFGGDFTVNGGTFALGNGTVNVDFNGTTQSLANAGSAIAFQNVNFSNSGTKTLTSGSFSVATAGVLSLAANTTLNANGNLLLLSSSSGSATIAPIPSTSEITGNVTVQRFISGGSQEPYRTYRMISSPIYDNGNAADRTYSYAQFIDDMLVTGSGGSANGFDTSPFNNASAWVYTPGASPAFQDVTNINTSLGAGKSAYIYYRGDRSNSTGKFTSPYVDPEDLVMDFSGVLNQQSVVVPLANNGNLVGNPYASSIDWNSAAITKTGLTNNVIRIWNPASRSYATYDGTIGVPSSVNNIIPAGQGFFVQATGSGTLTFTEGAKVTAQPTVLLMSTPTNENLIVQKLAVSGGGSSIQATPQTELRLTLSLNGSIYSEETAVVFKAGKAATYSITEDANYLHNYSTQDGGQKVFLSSRSTDNRDLAINYMPEITNGSNVKLNINAFNEGGNYKLKVDYRDVPSGYIVKLNDAFLGTSTVVQNGDLHSFTIDKTQAGSYGIDRFSVAFEAPTTLPVTYQVPFTAAKTNQGVLTKWSTATETDNNRFEVMRAADDKAYAKLHTELAKGSNSSYSFIDKNPLLGNNYYKLVQFNNDGTSTESLPQVINYTGILSNTSELVSIFPNPVVSNFTVRFNGVLKANQQTVKVVNVTGQVLLTQSVSKSQMAAGHEINISAYPSGIYFVEVYENGSQRLGQMKLIKQ
ncbi:T9SS type A sorting domain-containing protein [Pedobacter helvus]|uniref:T9SS type A sorting domain-containing protein n=1 Tax=Pedobacter helvus TaxID=2563444 RepID=A0ABW9JK38_9SPHI|nr:T9SS type A sorting domain-containing protein [Pedobacter ureilyticus]